LRVVLAAAIPTHGIRVNTKIAANHRFVITGICSAFMENFRLIVPIGD
jgi:hypothetical protein